MAVKPATKQTPLFNKHQSMGAKLVDFSGWDMPLQFSKVIEEHHAVRQDSGVFDICHMGLLSIYHPEQKVDDVLNALDRLVGQDLSKLYPGKAVYTHLLTEDAGIIDDVIIYYLPQGHTFAGFYEVLLICNAGTTQKVTQWLNQQLGSGFKVDWMNKAYGFIALQGPNFKQPLETVSTGMSSQLPKRFHMNQLRLGDYSVLVTRTGYTGEDGVELIVPVEQVESLWQGLIDGGSQPIGLAARDTLRLEAAYPLYGSELHEKITPFEAGLGWSVKLEKSNAFMGQAVLKQQQEQGLKKHFVCFTCAHRSIPRHDDVIYNDYRSDSGVVTSGSYSPTLNQPIGVGYIYTNVPPAPGSTIFIGIRGNLEEATIVERPFYKR